eukprot:m.13402 g.13402  ORF g.13402 m.13402 type:complete len:81 (+) comp24776_c0_seq1:2385-2627(+)
MFLKLAVFLLFHAVWLPKLQFLIPAPSTDSLSIVCFITSLLNLDTWLEFWKSACVLKLFLMEMLLEDSVFSFVMLIRGLP